MSIGTTNVEEKIRRHHPMTVWGKGIINSGQFVQIVYLTL